MLVVAEHYNRCANGCSGAERRPPWRGVHSLDIPRGSKLTREVHLGQGYWARPNGSGLHMRMAKSSGIRK